MSYSRWGNSYWYTFYCVYPEEGRETKDNALFDVCMIATFTAKDLREDMDSCIEIVSKKDPYATKEQLGELRIYMSEFLKDVDETYK